MINSRYKNNVRGKILAYVLVVILGLLALCMGIYSGLSEERSASPGAGRVAGSFRIPPGEGKTPSRKPAINPGVEERPEAPGKPPVASSARQDDKGHREEHPEEKPDASPKAAPEGGASPARHLPDPESDNGPRVAILIDDFGNSLRNVDEFSNLEIPITFAILPRLPYSRKIARMAKDSGKEIILHLPMENHAGVNPGPGTILAGMTRDELASAFKANLETVPGAVGINNHEGSKATESAELMGHLMKLARDEGLFFIDSFTTPRSTVLETARREGVPSIKRNVFLDNEDSEEYIAGQLDALARKALADGYAVGIGHCRRNTYLAIEKAIPKMQEKGIQFVPVSELAR